MSSVRQRDYHEAGQDDSIAHLRGCGCLGKKAGYLNAWKRSGTPPWIGPGLEIVVRNEGGPLKYELTTQ